jgi:hypothetical protein
MKKTFLLLLLTVGLSYVTVAQSVIYSEPDREDSRSMNYEIMGKLNGKVLVYKGTRELHFISVYDVDMKPVNKVRLDFINEYLIDVSFLAYSDKIILFYEYQKRNIVYSMAANIDANGRIVGSPIQLDTTAYSSTANNNIYTVEHSDDKQKIVLYKINNKDEKLHILTTLLFDKELNLLHKSKIAVPMPERNDFLNDLVVDNDGDIALLRESGTNSNDNINKVTLLIKQATEDNISTNEIKLNNINLDDIRLKPDNLNKRFLVASFYSKQRRGNVDGLFCYIWDKVNHKEILSTNVTFSDELRNDAKSDGTIKTAFNDFFLRNIVVKSDGGFALAAESEYTSSRGANNYNRWDYIGGSNYYGLQNYNYYGPTMGSYYYPWNRMNSYNNITRYFADNIVLLSFDDKGKIEWSNVIHKSQYDDNTDKFISYGLVNTGTEVHILYNVLEKRDLVITDQTISPDGQLTRKPTFKNLDKGYDFMPRQAKQTGAKQIIIPCTYRNQTCFAKIDF